MHDHYKQHLHFTGNLTSSEVIKFYAWERKSKKPSEYKIVWGDKSKKPSEYEMDEIKSVTNRERPFSPYQNWPQKRLEAWWSWCVKCHLVVLAMLPVCLYITELGTRNVIRSMRLIVGNIIFKAAVCAHTLIAKVVCCNYANST